MENSKKNGNDPGLPLHLAFHCIHCDSFSIDPNLCVNCGKRVSVINSGQLVSNVIEVDVVDLNKSVEADTKARKREITGYGMFLKEQKQLNRKTSQRLDSEAMIQKWKGLDETEKDVYRKKSVEDKTLIIGKKLISETKDRKRGSDSEERSKKNKRNKRDTELKIQKRESAKETENDVSTAKIMLNCMIAEKEENLLVLSKSLENNEKEIARLADENSLSDRLLLSKKEKLSLAKQKYKDLYNNNNDSIGK